MEMRIYVANLAAYVGGHLVGEWIDLPKDEGELEEEIQAILDAWNDGYGPSEEIAIHDYELPFKVGEYDNPYKINEACQRIEDSGVEECVLDAISDMYTDFESILDVVESQEYRIYWKCDDMSDVAYEFYEETGMMSDIPSHLQNYIDWERVGRDMEIEGTFMRGVDTSNGRYEPFYVEVTR